MERYDITAPATKAASAVASAAAASVMNHWPDAAFWPHDLGGWLAVAASAAAGFYTFLLITDWMWRRVWRPLFEWFGWIKPKPKAPHYTVVSVDSDFPASDVRP